MDLRSVWPLEKQGFSQWLVENIDFLNEHLPFEIDPASVSPEQAAGDFWVDVVGEAIDPGSSQPIKVIIENQLTQTDHDHLGKVLTYVAAFDASAAIWISARARPEHAKAVQWLNDEANIDAWLFDVEVINIGDSAQAPLLTQIVGPSDLSKRAKAERQGNELDRQQQTEFWSVVLPKVAEACASYGVWGRTRSVRSVQVWESVPSSPGRIGWQIWVSSQASWICLRIDGESHEEVDHYFTALSDRHEEIDGRFGPGLTWDPLEGSRSSIVRWDNPTPGGYRTDSESWPAAGDAIAEAMIRLVSATKGVAPTLPAFEHPQGATGPLAQPSSGDLTADSP